jgi:hypothetical protein
MHMALTTKDTALFNKAAVSCVKFEVLTAVEISLLVFWVVTPCGFVGICQHFGETYCLHLQV